MGGEKEEKIDDYNRILIFFFLFSETVHGLCLKFCLKEENKTRPFRLPSTCSFSQACGGDEEKTTPSARQTLIFLSLVWPVLRCLSLHREVMSVLSWRSYSFLLKSARKGRKRQEEPPQQSHENWSWLMSSCCWGSCLPVSSRRARVGDEEKRTCPPHILVICLSISKKRRPRCGPGKLSSSPCLSLFNQEFNQFYWRGKRGHGEGETEDIGGDRFSVNPPCPSCLPSLVLFLSCPWRARENHKRKERKRKEEMLIKLMFERKKQKITNK